MKKKKQTFADKANSIQTRYNGRENDEMALEAMEMELSRLMKEQEAYKVENNMGNDTQKLKNGGSLPTYGDGGDVKSSNDASKAIEMLNKLNPNILTGQKDRAKYSYYINQAMQNADSTNYNAYQDFLKDNNASELPLTERVSLGDQWATNNPGKLNIPSTDFGNYFSDSTLDFMNDYNKNTDTTGTGTDPSAAGPRDIAAGLNPYIKHSIGDYAKKFPVSYSPTESGADSWFVGEGSSNMMPKMAYGGSLPKYDGVSGSSTLNKNPGGYSLSNLYDNNFQADYAEDYGFLNDNPEINTVDSLEAGQKQYEPKFNWMAPLATSATNVFANIIESKNKQRAKESMIKNADVNLARISPQKLDLGRERSSIRGERDLVAASGRRRSQGASSAAERANIENAARIASQRVAGRQLGDSYGREEAANLDARQKADMFNAQQSSREAELTNKNKMMAERMYGSPGGLDWLPGSLRSTGKNFSNAAQEFQKNQLLYKQLGLMNENYMVDQDGNTVLRKKQK